MQATQSTRRLAIEYVPIGTLKPDPGNPRTHSETQLKKLARSIRRFGWVSPVVVDANSNIIAGHGRVAAAKRAGFTEAPVIRISDLTPAEARAYQIADNQLAALADWDRQKLGILFMELSVPELQIELEDTGFDMGEIDVVIGELEAPSRSTDPADDVPVEPGPAVSVLSDAWRLGRHLLVCGDATLSETFSAFGGKAADMVFIDPPYNVHIPGHVSGNGRIVHAEFAMASGEMSPDEFTAFLNRAFAALANNSVDGSIHYVCMDWRHLRELLAAGDTVYKSLLNLCVWEKDNAGLGAFYRSQHELIAVFKHGKAPHRNNVQLGKFGRYRTNIWKYPCARTFSRSGEEGNLLAQHATPKPVALVQDAILDCTARGDVVMDTFLGSGTTLIACERSGRVCHGVELEPRFVDVAVRRWEAHTGDQAVHVVTGKTFAEMAEVRAVEEQEDHGQQA